MDDWDAVFGAFVGGKGCWEWPEQARDRDGYGLKRYQGCQWRAHRLSYALATGEDIEDLQVRHTCDNPPCVRPGHLIKGTNQDNMNDKVERGRTNNQYASATHCKRGHPFDEVNTYINPTSGARQCRTCRRNDNKAREQAKKEKKS